MDIKVEDIVVDPKLVDRTDGLDFVTVQTYADDMESGAVFPAVEIVSDSESSWLVDGVSTDWQLRNSLGMKLLPLTLRKGIIAMRC